MHDFLVIIHILGVAMGIGVSFSHMVLGITRSKMDPESARKDAVRSLSLSILGTIGMILLIISGIFLMSPYWDSLFTTPLLVAKLSLVLLLILLLIFIEVNIFKAKKTEGREGLKPIEKVAKFTLPIAVAIVVLAVLVFN